VRRSAQSFYNDIDKTMPARLGTLDETGIYSAAYRLIDIAFIPVRAVLNAALPGFFHNGVEGISGGVVPAPLPVAVSQQELLRISFSPGAQPPISISWLGDRSSIATGRHRRPAT
jgi:O-antigen/teichoic acid export membrane protein